MNTQIYLEPMSYGQFCPIPSTENELWKREPDLCKLRYQGERFNYWERQFEKRPAQGMSATFAANQMMMADLAQIEGTTISFTSQLDWGAAANKQNGDMPEAVLDGRLGEIYQRRLSRFPIAYGWPALIAAAGVMVPVVEATNTRVGQELTTFFTGLVGPVHSGKSQAILWANSVLGLPRDHYTNVKAGSSEGLLRKLNKMRSTQLLKDAALIDLDEWKFLFNKAGIDNSSFTSFLQTAFYNRRHNTTLSRGQEVEFDCALSFIGGIVQDEFEECFGANSMGGLHDRFTFGLCPEGFNFMYRPFEGSAEALNPIPVMIDGDVFEMIEAIRKADPKIGREAEIAVRVAHVSASFDGRPILYAKDCETSVRAFIAEQARIRQLLQPNEGTTLDAVMSNALLRWLERNAGSLEVVPEREVHHGLRKTISKLGMGCLEYATRNLVRQGLIWNGDIPGGKVYAGRTQRGYQLLKQSE